MTGDWITTISFENNHRMSSESLTFAIFYILPQLPRLERIEHFDFSTTRRIFGPQGLATNHRGFKLSLEAQEERFALQKFLQVALRIKHWDIELNAEELRVIVTNSPQSITSLSIRSPPYSASPILETPSKAFSSVLLLCTSLSALQLTRSTSINNDRNQFNNLPFVHPSAITLPYPFSNTLTSLTLSNEDYSLKIVTHEALLFATRFRFLSHLRIDAFDFCFTAEKGGEDEELDYNFPHLTHLELHGSFIRYLDALLYRLVLPKIRIICIRYYTWYDWEMDDREGAIKRHDPRIEYLGEGLSRFASTLKHVYLRTQNGLYRKSSEKLVSIIEKNQPRGVEIFKLHFDDHLQLGEAELGVSNHKAEVDDRKGSTVKTKTKDHEVLQSITTSTRELAEWVLWQVETVEESKDIPQAKQLLRTMKLASDLQKWMED